MQNVYLIFFSAQIITPAPLTNLTFVRKLGFIKNFKDKEKKKKTKTLITGTL